MIDNVQNEEYLHYLFHPLYDISSHLNEKFDFTSFNPEVIIFQLNFIIHKLNIKIFFRNLDSNR
jgi:hypothetical protein